MLITESSIHAFFSHRQTVQVEQLNEDRFEKWRFAQGCSKLPRSDQNPTSADKLKSRTLYSVLSIAFITESTFETAKNSTYSLTKEKNNRMERREERVRTTAVRTALWPPRD